MKDLKASNASNNIQEKEHPSDNGGVNINTIGRENGDKKSKVEMIKEVSGDLLTDEVEEDLKAREAAIQARTSLKSFGSGKVFLKSASHVPGKAILGMPKLTPCQHMKRVKTVKNGWLSEWRGTWKGALYTHPEAPGTLWYHLIVTGPTSQKCQCLRMVPVPDTDSVDTVNSGTSLPITTKPGTLTSGKTLVDRKAGNQKFGFTYVEPGDTKGTDRPEWGFGAVR